MSEDWDAIAQEVNDVTVDLGTAGMMYRKPTGGASAPHLAGAPTKDTTGTPFTYFPSSFHFKDNAYFKIDTGDVAIIVPAQYAPTIGDRVTIRSESWRIEGLQRVDPQGTTLFFKAQLRKA